MVLQVDHNTKECAVDSHIEFFVVVTFKVKVEAANAEFKPDYAQYFVTDIHLGIDQGVSANAYAVHFACGIKAGQEWQVNPGVRV